MTDRAPEGSREASLDRMVRRVWGRLIAGLVSRLGHRHLALAEDVAQEALLVALTTWPTGASPDQPAAWLGRVAMRKAIDRLRREKREIAIEAAGVDEFEVFAARETAQLEEIGDPELRLMFLACHPTLGRLDRAALTLRVVNGFSNRELAEIFLSSEDAIAQRLSRSKKKLRALGRDALQHSIDDGWIGRLEDVHKVLYLMFSLGYSPRSGGALIRREVAFEAKRLACGLASAERTATASGAALAALFCLQASRFDAREGESGRPILLPEQDRGAWDRTLIETGLRFLERARGAKQVSRYHLEAGIAACYATAKSWETTDWAQILALYGVLDATVDSPTIRINRAVALAFSGDPEPALARLDEFALDPRLQRYAPYYIARAEVLRLLGRPTEAHGDYNRAIARGASAPVLEHLEHRLAAC